MTPGSAPKSSTSHCLGFAQTNSVIARPTGFFRHSHLDSQFLNLGFTCDLSLHAEISRDVLLLRTLAKRAYLSWVLLLRTMHQELLPRLATLCFIFNLKEAAPSVYCNTW